MNSVKRTMYLLFLFLFYNFFIFWICILSNFLCIRTYFFIYFRLHSPYSFHLVIMYLCICISWKLWLECLMCVNKKKIVLFFNDWFGCNKIREMIFPWTLLSGFWLQKLRSFFFLFQLLYYSLVFILVFLSSKIIFLLL